MNQLTKLNKRNNSEAALPGFSLQKFLKNCESSQEILVAVWGLYVFRKTSFKTSVINSSF